ncbi:MAG: lamin tail domain-containing protein [Verrucomicrobiota bacterium]
MELYNYSNQTNDLSGCILTDNPGTNKFIIPPGTTIAPRSFRAFTQSELGFGLKASGDTIYLKNPDASRVLDAIRFDAQAENVPLGRQPNGRGELYPLTASTTGAANASIKVNDIVINELMYHPISGADDDQFIELFNRGSNAVNVSGWQIAAGVNFTIPPGTLIASNGYLVIAENLTNLLARYPNLNSSNTVGNFSGALAHSGERVALAMQQINVTTNGDSVVTNTLYVVVDEVTYADGGRGTKWADGGGSSLELVDPRADHRLPANWADSDETAKAAWTTIEATGVLDLGMPGWNASSVQALLFDEGECLLDNVEVISGSSLVANGTFESGTNGWFLEGNHERTSLETNGFSSSRSLHLRTSGGGDSYANRVRTALTSTIASGATATLRAKVRWLCGNPEILLRLRGNWLEATGPLSVPANLGTPGARNSRSVTNAGPAIVNVAHDPVLPAANQAVIVTATLADPDGISSVQLKYRVDSAAIYSTVVMLDNGTSGDAIAGDGIFSATIPGQSANSLIAFYVEATDGFSLSVTTRFPNDAPSRECLVRFGETQPFGSFGTYRLWLTQASFNRWANRRKTSDEPVDCTLVIGNQRAIYNVGAYYSGSPWKSALSIIDTPTGNMCDYNLRLPKDEPLLGTALVKMAFPGNVDVNNQGIDQTAQMEPTLYWFARKLGLRVGCFRHVNFFINGTRRGSIIYDVQVPNSDFVEHAFSDDDNGDLFEGSFWFEADSVDEGLFGEYNDSFATMANFTTTGGAKKKARYRWNFPRHGIDGSANDYTNWFALVDALNVTSNYTAAVESLVDADQWMRVFAYEHLVNNWEAFGFAHGVNMFPYKGRQGRWNLIPNDVDISFLGSPSDLFAVDDPVLQRMIDHPPFRRAYWRALQDAVNGPLLSTQVNALCDPRYAALQANGINVSSPSGIKSFIASMRSHVLSQLATVATGFSVNGPAAFATNQSPVMLSGTASIEVAAMTVNGSLWPVTWTSVANWSMSLPLVSGLNTLNIVGLNRQGQPVAGASATITVNFTGSIVSPPKIVINEWMASNTGFIRDPADNDADDWFELYNPTATPVNLAGWFLSDDLSNRFQFTVPAGYNVPAHGYLLVWADDEPQQNATNRIDLHVNFKLDKAGDAIVLSTTNGTVMDAVSFGLQTNNISQGHYPDGGTNLFFQTVPTPQGGNYFVPDAPRFNAIDRTGNVVTLHFIGTPGIDCQIEFKESLDAPSWTSLGGRISMASSTGFFTDSIGTNTYRFYRLVLLP